MASNIIGGTATLKVGGVQYKLRGNFKVAPLETENTGVAGADGVHGYTVKHLVPYIEADISDWGGFSVVNVGTITGTTITLALGNGKVYTLTNAHISGPVVLDGVQGQMQVKFEGDSCPEVTA